MSAIDGSTPSASKFIMVTGAAGGIGRATASRLAEAGHIVFAADRRESALQTFAAEHPEGHAIALDVTDQSSIADCGVHLSRSPRSLRVCRSHGRSLSLPSGGLTTRRRVERALPSARKLNLRDSDLDHGEGTKAMAD